MKIAFYYHIPIKVNTVEISAPSFLGVFLDSLASQSEQLYLVMHTANAEDEKNCDYILKSKNIVFIDLGIKTPAWHRAIFYKKILKNPLRKISHCDTFIVRSPSPLSPYFHKYYKGKKLYFMIVGDYLKSIGHLKKDGTPREKAIYHFLSYNQRLFEKRIKKTPILVNSIELFEQFKMLAPKTGLIKTTTLSQGDFHFREDTCQNKVIKLIFTGRIEPAKGLFELFEAVAQLVHRSFELELHLAGWEEDEVNKPIESRLLKMANDLKIDHIVFFHGRKSVGPELNAIYRIGDMYILPSYHEGFPRTIWEAMANSLPVIATTVGGIPTYLAHEQSAYLIQPKRVEEIISAIQTVIENGDLRRKMIRNGRTLAESNTLEIQTKNMLNIIQNQ